MTSSRIYLCTDCKKTLGQQRRRKAWPQDTKLSLFVSFRNRIYWFCHTVCESIAKSDAKEIWPLNSWLISISDSIFSHLNFDYRLIINCESTFTQKLFLFGLVKIMLYSNLSKKNTNTKTYCDNGHWFSLSILNHHLLSTTSKHWCISLSLLAYQVVNFAVTRPLTFYLLMQQ